MSLTITTLVPYNVQLGGSSGNINGGATNPGPPLIGDGSLVDDSDLSGVELGSNSDVTELVFADFTMSEAQNPTWCYVWVRLKTSAGYAPANPLPILVMQEAGDPSSDIFLNLNWPDPIEAGDVSTPTSFGLGYAGPEVPIGSDPAYENNWVNIVEDVPQIRAALTGPGLHIGLGVLSVNSARAPYVDLFEVRLVVAYESGRRQPHLRQYPRSPLRLWPPERSVQRSLRQGPGAFK